MISSVLSAFLVLTSLFPLYRGREYATVRAEGSVEGGNFRGIYDPALGAGGHLGAEGVALRKGLMLHGRFDYGYDYGTGSRWRGWIDPYETPFMLCDSIPGNVSKETYDMEASLAFPTGKWCFGINACYRTTIFAKHKDLRNKNTRMDVSVAPSFAYCGDKFRAGLALGYFRNTEQVEYIQVDDSSEKYLFRIYGLWLFSSSGFSSAETRRFKENNGAFSDLHLEYGTGTLLVENDFHVRYSYGSQTETGYNNLHYGDTQFLSYRDDFSFRLRGHRITAFWEMGQTLGLRSLQRQELDPDSKIRRWYSYGGLTECYYRSAMQAGGQYRYETEQWSVSAGVDWLGEKQYYREYPALFSQRLSLLEPHLGAFVRFDLGKKAGGLDLEASLRYRQPLDGIADEITTFAPTEAPAEEAQLLHPLYEEFNYRYANSIGAGLNVRWTLPVGRRGHRLSLGIGVQHTSALSAAMNGRFRTGGALSVGYHF